MSHDLQLLLAKTRELIATTRRLQAEHQAEVRKYITTNIELHARSLEAISESADLLSKHRD